MYYHLVQSFPKGDGTSPELAHRIAVELVEKTFGKYECVVATHIDREHIHSHFVFNLSASRTAGSIIPTVMKQHISGIYQSVDALFLTDHIRQYRGTLSASDPKPDFRALHIEN